MKRTHLLGLIALLLALPAAAGAEDTYLNLKGGVFLPNGKSASADKRENGLNSFDAGYSLDVALGYKLESYVAVELGTGLYSAEGKITLPNSSDTLKLYAVPLTATVKGLLPLGKTELYAGAGGGYYFGAMDRTQVNGTTGTTVSETSHGGALGYHLLVGGDYRLNTSFTLGAEFKWFATKPELEFTDPSSGNKIRTKWELGGSTVGLSAKYWF